MRSLERIIDGISNFSGFITGWLILGVMGLTMIEVVSRYILRRPIMLADEFGGYSFAAIAFLGLAYTMKEGRHIRIQFVVNRLPVKISNWLRVFTLSAALVYTMIASYVSYNFIIDAFNRNIRAASHLMTPLAWPQLVLPIGFTLLAIVLLSEVAKAIRNLRSGVSTEALARAKDEEEGL